jgi:hypothetical protein
MSALDFQRHGHERKQVRKSCAAILCNIPVIITIQQDLTLPFLRPCSQKQFEFCKADISRHSSTHRQTFIPTLVSELNGGVDGPIHDEG